MLFNSPAFLLLFLPIVVIGANMLRDYRSLLVSQTWVVVASLVFYGWGRPFDVVLLLASIVFNAAVSQRIVAVPVGSPARRYWLQLGLIVDVGVLCLFKYMVFLFPGIGSVPVVAALARAIPLGISFYTLMQVMYLVDCYEDLIGANSLFQHAIYVSFFPHLTAGPIDRTKTFVRQLPALASRDMRWQNIGRGLVLLAIGIVKKAVIADAFGRIADAGYGAVGALSTAEAWATTISYTLQLYFDFSGYTDMAMGSALLLGISLTKNFNAPYRAISISDFWRRWHISLSAFITTYLYTPIIRSFGRITIHTATAATIVAMAITGLWHGAAWTFVVFGILHGVALAVNQYWKKLRRPLPNVIAWALTFAFVNFAFIPFRALTLTDAASVVRLLIPHRNLFSHTVLSQSIRGAELLMIAGPALVGAVTAFVGPTSDEIASRLQWTPRMAFATSGLFLIGLLYLNSNAARDFVYFRF